MNHTYTSDDVFGMVEQIAQTSSKKTKEMLVKEYIEASDLFTNVVFMAYNPLTSFGVKALPERTEPGAGHFNIATMMLLSDLADRNITGGEAQAAIQTECNRLTEQSEQLFRRILLKDLRAGFGASTINKAKPGLVPDPPYMRCSLPPKSNMDSWNWSDGVLSQLKADGMFGNVDVKITGDVRVTTRQGPEMPLYALEGFEEAAKAVLKPGTQTHGEFVVLMNGVEMPREESNGVMNSLANGGALEEEQTIVFYAWDQIPLSEVRAKNKYNVPYGERFKELLSQIQKASNKIIKAIPTKIVPSKQEAMEHYKQMLRAGKEGTVLKSPKAIWMDGTSKDQVKFKLEVPVELEVIGVNPGTGKYEGMMGSFQCASSCGLLKVDVNCRGDAQRQEDPTDWLGAIITVKANSIMSPEKEGDPHSLFLPIFLERRTDKSEADSLEQIKDQFAAAVA